MPAHVFVQLGMWHEAADSDERSFRASETWVKRKKLPSSMRDFHSLSWLLYESLQRGRFQRARETLEILGPVVKEAPAARLKSVLSDMRARYVVETRSYADLATARDFDTTSELFALGLSAARRSDASKAAMALAELGRRAGARSGGGRSLDVAVMEKELDAVMAVMAGRGADAITRMQEAVALERDLPPPMGPPRPIKPASELFGEILLELGKPREAVTQFEAALAHWSNRSPALLGLGRAHAALGDRAAARKAYERFLANWSQADPGLPELQEASAFSGR
jgi:tetratricopeptide (TPR) repeat protein